MYEYKRKNQKKGKILWSLDRHEYNNIINNYVNDESITSKLDEDEVHILNAFVVGHFKEEIGMAFGLSKDEMTKKTLKISRIAKKVIKQYEEKYGENYHNPIQYSNIDEEEYYYYFEVFTHYLDLMFFRGDSKLFDMVKLYYKKIINFDKQKINEKLYQRVRLKTYMLFCLFMLPDKHFNYKLFDYYETIKERGDEFTLLLCKLKYYINNNLLYRVEEMQGAFQKLVFRGKVYTDDFMLVCIYVGLLSNCRDIKTYIPQVIRYYITKKFCTYFDNVHRRKDTPLRYLGLNKSIKQGDYRKIKMYYDLIKKSLFNECEQHQYLKYGYRIVLHNRYIIEMNEEKFKKLTYKYYKIIFDRIKNEDNEHILIANNLFLVLSRKREVNFNERINFLMSRIKTIKLRQANPFYDSRNYNKILEYAQIFKFTL